MLAENLGIFQDCIIARDHGANRMTQGEHISTIATLVGCSTKQAKRTYNYCIENNYFNRLNKGDRARKAQAISIKQL